MKSLRVLIIFTILVVMLSSFALVGAQDDEAVVAEPGQEVNMVLLPKFLGILVFDQANEGAMEAHEELENPGRVTTPEAVARYNKMVDRHNQIISEYNQEIPLLLQNMEEAQRKLIRDIFPETPAVPDSEPEVRGDQG